MEYAGRSIEDRSGNPTEAAVCDAEWPALPAVLTLFDAVAIVVGSIIGSGVFLRLPSSRGSWKPSAATSDRSPRTSAIHSGTFRLRS